VIFDPAVPTSILTVPDADLRSRTVFAGVISGSLNAPLEVGQIIRVQARQYVKSDQTLSGGNIDADITATERDFAIGGDIGTEFTAIGSIRASNRISGNITASGRTTSYSGTVQPRSKERGSIGRVVVGPSLNAEGITGNIRAPLGRIGAVFSTGKIGTSPEIRSKIEAGDGVLQVCVNTEFDGFAFFPAIEKPIYADIAANLDYDLAISGNNGLGAAPISLIETGGDFKGSVKSASFFPYVRNSQGLSGVMARGVLDAEIDVEYDANYPNFIGTSIRKPIKIGLFLKGAIIAYGQPGAIDPLGGSLNEVVIGFAQTTATLPQNTRRGLIATANAPIDLRQPNEFPQGSVDNAAIDSLIRAKNAGSIQLAGISHMHIGGYKNGRPRIEVEQLQNLYIGTMETGSVWSGRLEYVPDAQSPDQIANDWTNDFAQINNIVIDCMSPKADLWVRDVPLTHIRGDMLGEIRMPRLAVGETIRIDGRLGSVDDPVCGGCDIGFGGGSGDPGTQGDPGVCYTGHNFNEDSPRAPWVLFGEASDGIAQHSSIRLFEADGLKGNIVIHAGNSSGVRDPGEYLTGAVALAVEPDPNRDDILSTTQPQPSQLPLYNRKGTTLGGAASGIGGSVGLVPFAIHTQDSAPVLRSMTAGGLIVKSLFESDARQVRAAFYGPVRSAAVGGSSPVLIEREDASGFTNAIGHFNVFVSGRELVISRKVGQVYPYGRYRVTPLPSLRCDVGRGVNDPAVDATPFFFAFSGCELPGAGGLANPADIADDQDGWLLDPNRNTAVPNGGVNEGDYNLFFNGFFVQNGLGLAAVGMSSDIANDAGEFPGSSNYDPATENTGVNEGDYNAFFNTFFAGCSV
jgi:hypothetical protein